ncbi:hypothetical protein [Roseivirga pacifica]|uniref:hypothetical protein n=1 Tax=Roseivirga pacifica TaxID=1267423 RepID=UPI00227A62C2|nr:hypothetical protein [Roseivirga pacifica]
MNKAIFKTYLKSTLTWPQKRGGVNIYMIETIFSLDDPIKELKIFCDSPLPEKDKLVIVMDRAHGKVRSGIRIPKEKLNLDWAYTKGAIIRSLLLFLRGIDCYDHRLMNYKDLLTIENINEIKAHFNREGILIRDVQEKSTFLKHILDEYNDLSRLFRHSFCSSTQLKDVFAKYETDLIQYCWRYFNHSHLNRLSPEIVWSELGSLIELKLGIMSKDKYGWLLWDFISDQNSSNSLQ